MTRSMKIFGAMFILLALVGAAGWFSPGDLRAQGNFDEVEKLLETAKTEGAELLSPKSYSLAMDEYQKAVELRDKGKSLKDIDKRLEKANQIAQSVINNIKLAEVTFADVFPERNKAIQAKAAEFVPDEWAKAEEEFQKAVVSLEEGKVKHAKSRLPILIDMYQSVEISAIKVDIMGEAKALSIQIEKEVSELAPITYRKGLEKIEAANQVLDRDRYSRDDAEILIREAQYELRHSRSLARRISEWSQKDLESLMLEFEGNLLRIAEGMDLAVRFDDEVQKEVTKLAEKANELQLKNRNLSAELYSLKEEMAESQQLKESLQKRLEEEAKKKERLSRVQSLFTTSEAKVFRDEKDNIVLRLIGFSFPPGSSQIEPAHFDLLSRVQQALAMFPGSRVVIEGHTDSMGDEKLNKTLSQSRAEAIQQYLVANQALDSTLMNAVGFGEERPIANNETEQGRRLNRRVDIVVTPSG